MSASKELFMQLREDSELQPGVSFEHLIDARKSNLETAVNTISQAVKDGNVDSLKALILSVKGKALFTDLEKSLRPLAENDYLDKLEKNYTAHDTKVEQAPTKTEYDYSVCNDPVYNALAEQLDLAKIKVKDREGFLKGIKGPLTIVDQDTGEVSTIYPPNKLQSDGLKLTIK